jgi:hypothetical protein
VVDSEHCTVQVGLLFIRVNVVCAIVNQGVEQPHVVEYTVVPLLKVEDLLQLAAEQTRRKVMCMEGSTEFIPWNMVILR